VRVWGNRNPHAFGTFLAEKYNEKRANKVRPYFRDDVGIVPYAVTAKNLIFICSPYSNFSN
ncbi:MAG: hypothetical protein IKJ05_06190, partial [Oscillospiraceae bacterium]|nr:hypothetical protein [Oscillospiraceae bacterium]